MEQKIKEIRVTLDGLKQLTESLKPYQKVIFDLSAIPKEQDTINFVKTFFDSPYSFIDSKQQDKNYNAITIIPGERYTCKAIDSLELSKMWLGKCLKELGTTNPYPESKNPNNEIIEPTADRAGIDDMLEAGKPAYDYGEFTHIQKVKYLRAEIEKVEIQLKDLSKKGFGLNTGFAYTHLYDSLKYCIESGMFLGLELSRCRETENK